MGDAVLITLDKGGTAGGTSVHGPRKPVARVVKRMKPFGARMYRVRTNAGVLDKLLRPDQLERAPQRSADTLRFEGVATAGVPRVTEHAARGKREIMCRCRGARCGPKCPCKEAGSRCHRACGCKHGKGANCGNCE